MPTTGIINGKLMRIQADDVDIGYATECSMSLSQETRDTSNKDSGGWEDTLPGLKSATFTTNALYAFDATEGLDNLWVEFNGDTEVTVRFTTSVSGDNYYQAACVITQLELTAANEENSAFTATFKANGAVTQGTEI